jgi:hypothetical protein
MGPPAQRGAVNEYGISLLTNTTTEWGVNTEHQSIMKTTTMQVMGGN